MTFCLQQRRGKDLILANSSFLVIYFISVKNITQGLVAVVVHDITDQLIISDLNLFSLRICNSIIYSLHSYLIIFSKKTHASNERSNHLFILTMVVTMLGGLHY